MNVVTVLPAEVDTPARARRFMTSVLRGTGTSDDMTDAAVLLMSELAANAVIHGGGDTVRLHVRCDGPRLRIEVDDPSDSVPVEAEAWRGLGVIASISHRWGVTPKATGKTVWCQLQAEEPGAAPCG